MGKEQWDRFAAACGMVSVAIFLVAGLVYGNAPDVGAEPTAVVDFFRENRDQVLWAVFIQGFGVLALLWFTGALADALRRVDETRLAFTGAMAFALALALGAVATLLRAAIAFSIADVGDAAVAAGIFQTAALIDTAQNVVSAGIFIAIGAAVLRTAFLPRWWGWVSLLAGAWAVVSATAWQTDGFWSPDGAGFANFVVYVVWVGITSLLMTMRPRGVQPTA